ncbi:hypothetical protein FNO01nite_16010 [Flavobacterium noncentrifugens]|uniref:Uncharacterized protein n=1 Tax=Flavobacterium noncentrifugens TaxID=1128970 RepID=A0A1G8WIU1_9FLAO|nr:hypothetical protein [Flavobacterium noncentrifugens]GEP50929.1 hypothetical protein FNO01nite_16010 [Flavobacterium noncentrifugens]SDJ77575.1 hypothetical protein SAMN04487935_1818 [Flavobacterium noncentrifugens]
MENNPIAKKAVFINQIKKIYENVSRPKEEHNLEKTSSYKKVVLELNEKGEYTMTHVDISKRKKQTNFRTYLNRAVYIMGDKKIKKQARKSRKIVTTEIQKNLQKP